MNRIKSVLVAVVAAAARAADGASDLLIQPDGRIVAAGLARNRSSSQPALVRRLP